MKLTGNENVKLFTNPATNKVEMYVSETLIPEQIRNMAARIIGQRGDILFCKAADWNYFFVRQRLTL